MVYWQIWVCESQTNVDESIQHLNSHRSMLGGNMNLAQYLHNMAENELRYEKQTKEQLEALEEFDVSSVSSVKEAYAMLDELDKTNLHTSEDEEVLDAFRYIRNKLEDFIVDREG